MAKRRSSRKPIRRPRARVPAKNRSSGQPRSQHSSTRPGRSRRTVATAITIRATSREWSPSGSA